MRVIDRLKEEIDSYFKRDPAMRSRVEVVLCYPGFHAILVYRLSSRLWRADWKLIARLLSHVARFFTGVEIHPGARIGKRLFVDHGMGVVIGETASVGDDVTIYHGVTLGGVSPGDSARGELRHPQVGNNVIIGSGAQLLGPIDIGDGARIGSNAVVVKPVPPGAIMVGVPAREVQSKVTRFSNDQKEFSAYGGASGDVVDPRQQAIETLLKEVGVLKARVEELEKQNTNIEDTAGRWENKN